MAPRIDTVYSYFGTNDLELFVLSIDRNADNPTIVQFIEDYNLHYPAISGIDGAGLQIHDEYEIPYTPVVILIAPDHSIVEQGLSYDLYAKDFIDVIESYGVVGVGLDDVIEGTSYDFNVYPNPVVNQLYLDSPYNAEIRQINIYQLTGQKIFSNEISTSINSIDVSDFQKGIYLLSVDYKSGKRITKTFVKQ